MTIERYQAKDRKSYAFISYVIGLVLLIAYLQYEFIILLQASLVAFGFMIVFQLYKIYENARFNKSTGGVLKGKTKPSFFDGFQLARKYFGINKKFIFTSTLGLILAILVISQQMIVTTSYQQDTYDNFVNNNDHSALKFEIYQMNDTVFDDWKEYSIARFSQWITSPELTIDYSFSEGNINFKIFMGHTFNLDARTRYAHTLPTSTHSWNRFYYDFYSLLPSFSGFEFNESESVIVIPPNLQVSTPPLGTDFYDLEDFIQVIDNRPHIPILVNSDRLFPIHNTSIPWSFDNITYPVDRVWQLTDQDMTFIHSDNVLFPDGFDLSNMYFPVNQEWDLYHTLIDAQVEFNQPAYVWGDAGYTTRVGVNQPLLVDMPLSEVRFVLDESIYKTKFEIDFFLNTHQSYAQGYARDSTRFQLSSPLSNLINEFEDGFYNLDDSMRLSSTPLLLASLFLLFFSLSLVEKRKERLFSMMITRGTSVSQIRMMIIYEVVLSSIIASSVAMALSVPISELFLRSSGILQFNADPVPLIIPTLWWIKIPLLGLLLALLFNSVSIYNVAKLEIEDTLEGIESKPPIWERLNLDLILVAFSLFYWFVILFIPISQNASQYLFVSYGRPALVISIIGFPWIVGRYFMRAIARALIIFKIRFDLLSLAIRNINTHRSFTAQLISILMIGMMLTFMGLVTSDTVSEVSNERSLYSLGAEIVVDGANYHNEAIVSNVTIEGVESVSFVRYVEFERGFLDVPKGENPDNWPITYFMAIDPATFAETAYWRSNYADSPLGELITTLNESENGMIIQSEFAKAFNLSLGDTYQFRYGNYAQESFNFNVSETIDYFPRFMVSHPEENEFGFYAKNEFYVLTTHEVLDKFIDDVNPDVDTQLIYVNAEEGYDVRELATQIKSNLLPLVPTVFEVYDYRTEKISLLGADDENSGLAEQEAEFLNLAVHAILVFTFVIAMISISYYSFIFVGERKKEIGIYRALGMKRSQIQRLLFYEISLMVVISIIFGLICGYFLSFVSFIVLFNQQLNPIPPFRIIMPLNVIIYFSIAVTLVGLLIAFIPAWQNSRNQTGNILRAA